MKTAGSVSAVIAALDDEVAIELERMEAEAGRALAPLERPAAPMEVPDRERRLTVAHARAHERLAHEDFLDRRAELEARERWLRHVIAVGSARLAGRETARRAASVTALADEALAAIPARDCVLLVAANDRPLLNDQWRAERVARVGKHTLRIETADIDGGCVAMSEDGRVRFDNSFAARSERLDALWRSRLARLFNEAEP